MMNTTPAIAHGFDRASVKYFGHSNEQFNDERPGHEEESPLYSLHPLKPIACR
jgi:hypothetical protein